AIPSELGQLGAMKRLSLSDNGLTAVEMLASRRDSVGAGSARGYGAAGPREGRSNQ
ncbi:unnamed protein product, partial [Ectocarpus sp. 13 AM-2016]